MFKRFRKNEKGQAMVEYGLILALVSIISITSLGGIGGKFDKVVSVLGGSVVEGDNIVEDEDVGGSGGEDVVEDDTYTEGEDAGSEEDVTNPDTEEGEDAGSEEDVTNPDTEKGEDAGSEEDVTNPDTEKGEDVDSEGEEPTYTEEIQNLINQGYIPIATAGELNQLRHNKVQTFGGKQYRSGLDKKYIQVANIDLDGIDNFEPIGINTANSFTNTANSFTGTYDGGGYTISNLKIDRGSNDYAGLFGRIDGIAELKNIGLVNANVSGRDFVGGLVGHQYGGDSGSTITNSYTSGSVSGRSYVGGLVGLKHFSGITNSYTSGSVGGRSQVGGLVGRQHSGSIRKSYASGSVGGGNYVGGLVGYQYIGIITNSYATGSVSGTGNRVGGLVGYQNSGGTIINSY